jgi:MerR family transcriptional regulator, light-induced transcriptional regulator
MAPTKHPGYPIAAVARLTGLPLDTLRAWERRYDAVRPRRDDRGRIYTTADVTRLTLLGALVDEGHAIGRIAGLPDAALRQLHRASVPAAPPQALAANLAPLLSAVRRYDLPEIQASLNRFALMLAPGDLVFAVVLPLLRDVGERWEAGTIRPSQEHLVSAVIRSVLGGMLRTMARASRPVRMVLATPAGERHELGLLCAAVLAADRGVEVVYLGPDLPAADIAHASIAAAADILVLSGTAPNVVDYRDLAKLRKLARTEVWVGGPQAADIRDTVGTRARVLARLEEFCERLPRLGA